MDTIRFDYFDDNRDTTFVLDISADVRLPVGVYHAGDSWQPGDSAEVDIRSVRCVSVSHRFAGRTVDRTPSVEEAAIISEWFKGEPLTDVRDEVEAALAAEAARSAEPVSAW